MPDCVAMSTGRGESVEGVQLHLSAERRAGEFWLNWGWGGIKRSIEQINKKGGGGVFWRFDDGENKNGPAQVQAGTGSGTGTGTQDSSRSAPL